MDSAEINTKSTVLLSTTNEVSTDSDASSRKNADEIKEVQKDRIQFAYSLERRSRLARCEPNDLSDFLSQ